MAAIIHPGTCAWSYEDWRGPFYPKALAHGDWLEFYAQHLPCVEVDSTFYHIPSAETTRRWAERTPPDFRFTCKLPRSLTHEAGLRDCGQELTRFLDSLAPLGEKLGCVLIQLPPAFSPARDEQAMRHFIMGLPREIVFAVEFRHEGWHLPRITHFLEENRIAWAWTDMSSLETQNQPPFQFLPQTSDVLYLRLLGDLNTVYHPENNSGRHRYDTVMWQRETALENWIMKIEKHLDQTAHVFIHSGNHYEGFAPATCQRFASRLGVEISLPESDLKRPAPDPQLKLL